MLAVLLLTCQLSGAQCMFVWKFDTTAQCERAMAAVSIARPELVAKYPLHCETRPGATAPGLRT